MAYEESLRSITLDGDNTVGVYTGVPGTRGAANPNDAVQYRFVKLVGPHRVGLADADDTNVVGVLQNKPQVEGGACTVGLYGVSKVRAAKALTAGNAVKSDANGQATDTGSGPVLGLVVRGTAGAGELASVLLRVN